MALTLEQLYALPAPQVIEEIGIDAEYDAIVANFLADWAARRAENPALPAITTLNLETDPIAVQFENVAVRIGNIRARINSAARSQILAFSSGGDLEHLAAFYGVERMDGEEDDRLKRRVILAEQSRSKGGTRARYEFAGMTADIRVRRARAYTLGRSPKVYLAIFSTDSSGVASSELIGVVNAAVQDEKVRMLNDVIEVRSAVTATINVEADYWLLPGATMTADQMEETLRAAWFNEVELGRDFTVSWWVSRLLLPGVQKIQPVSPTQDQVMSSFQAAAIGTVKLNYRGGSF